MRNTGEQAEGAVSPEFLHWRDSPSERASLGGRGRQGEDGCDLSSHCSKIWERGDKRCFMVSAGSWREA